MCGAFPRGSSFAPDCRVDASGRASESPRLPRPFLERAASNELGSHESSLMPKGKSASTGPTSVQPAEHSSTAPNQLATVPTIGDEGE
jgi:hypothetical protein